MVWRNFIFTAVIAGASLSAWAAPILEDPVTWEDLRRVIARNDIRTRDQLLAVLPAKFRGSMKVVFASKSTAVSGVTSKTPRLVFSDDRSGFTLTMSTTPDGPDAGFIEVASPTGDYRIAEPKVIELGAQKNQRSIFIEDPYKAFAGHPSKDCRRCHSERFRYLWPGVYPAWPGVIGEQHNRFTSEVEIKALEDLKNNPIVGKYLDPKFLDPRNGISEFGDNNQQFNSLIATAHSNRIHHDLMNAKGIEEYRPLLSSLRKSDSLAGTFDETVASVTSPEFLANIPERKREEFRTTFADRLKKVVKRSEAFDRSVVLSDGTSRSYGAGMDFVGTQEIEYTLLEYVADDLQLPRRDWSWTLDSRAVRLNDGEGGLWRKAASPPLSGPKPPPLFNSQPPVRASASGESCAKDFGTLSTWLRRLLRK
jgi:hypothetical protein